MNRRFPKDFLNDYTQVIFTQPLAHGKYIKEIYTKENKKWVLEYESNSAFHICPYDGCVRNCADCGAFDEDFDINYCLNKQQKFTSVELLKRAEKCIAVDLEVKFID